MELFTTISRIVITCNKRLMPFLEQEVLELDSLDEGENGLSSCRYLILRLQDLSRTGILRSVRDLQKSVS